MLKVILLSVLIGSVIAQLSHLPDKMDHKMFLKNQPSSRTEIEDSSEEVDMGNKTIIEYIRRPPKFKEVKPMKSQKQIYCEDMDTKIYENTQYYKQLVWDKIDEAEKLSKSGVKYGNCLEARERGDDMDDVYRNATLEIQSIQETKEPILSEEQKKHIINLVSSSNATLIQIKNTSFECINNRKVTLEKQ